MTRTFAALALLLAAPFAAADTIRVDLGGGVALELVRVSKGEFEMGSSTNETGRGDDEKAHKVTIGRDFYIGKHPVTRGQFRRFVQETGYRTEAETGPSGGAGLEDGKLVQNKARKYTWLNPGFNQTDDHPVVMVAYADAQQFLRWLTKKSGRACELPTEAQWEYACRAGSKSAWHGGYAEEDL